MKEQTFNITVESGGGNITGFTIPEEVVTNFNAGLRIPVKVTINNYMYRSTLVKYNGKFMLPLASENREAAGVKAGDNVVMHLEMDTDPRVVEVPKTIEEIFKKEGLMEAFRTLSFTNQKEQIRSIEEAKSEETRQRRIEKTLAFIREKAK